MTEDGRRWLELRVRCPYAGDRADLLADGLVAFGARGVEERAGWYVSYFAEPEDVDAFVAQAVSVVEAETGLSPVLVEHGWQAHEAWEDTWKRGLDPRRVTDRIVVHPSWALPEEVRRDDIVIRLDPGMAFGTAEHGTTRGCLRLLDGLVATGDRLLDVGAGSGILSIAGARLGADAVMAIEGDGFACEAMRENVVANGVERIVTVHEAWATNESLASWGPVEGLVANIEAGLLAPLHEGFRAALKPGGWLILSGILGHEWRESRVRAESHGFEFVALDEDGDWRSGVFRRDA
ncbi:MAG: 50S ribosomal protein L11 methyltransferase [Gemmatimonadota bacterium]|nr:50S ribosomal protein L11 methyltransferase [Gemmatimonadota bacterium]MDE3012808.1 50S ribosomal protein L11 methyltransferase [Gemmatimonadota bacterium]